MAPRAFAVLQYLVEHAGRLVTQEQLLEALWPETFVQPEVLRKYILEIRRVLEDPPKAPRFVETLPRRGYRFIAPLQEDSWAEVFTSQAHPPLNLVGRRQALDELNSAMIAALHGQRQVVFVTGEPGIGKTSLVDAFHAQAARVAGARIARGQCVEGFGGKESYYPVLEAFGLFMRSPGGKELMDILASHAPTWLIQFPHLVGQEQRDLLRREILGATHERMLREICDALEFFTSNHPLILILEDLHLADDSTLDLISALARGRSAAKLLLIATYRPADVISSGSPLKALKQDLLIHRLCIELGLAPLTRDEIADYLNVEFPASHFDPALAALIHRNSDGNPLFMVALLERLRRQGWIAEVGERWVLTVAPGEIDPGVPETLQQMLEVQLGQLTAVEQHVLRAASVSGWRFPAWAVAAMTETGEAGTEQLCEDLAARDQFIRHAGIQELPDGTVSALYEFKHSLYRDVLYGRLPPTHRRQFHLRLAEKAESLGALRDLALGTEMAAHYEAGRDFARASRHLIALAGLATARFAHSDSVQILRHAMDLVAHLPSQTALATRIEILERLSDAFYAQGEMVRSGEMDYKVVELAGQAEFQVARINAWTRLARVLAFQDPEHCVAVCEKAVAAANAVDDPLLQASAAVLRACWEIVTNGWNPRDGEACTAALERVRALGAELPAYYEILYAHVQCVRGDYEGACRTARAGIPKALENGSLTVFLSAHSSLAYALLHLGRWGELREVLAVALSTAERNGNAPWAGIFQATLANLHLQAADVAGARERAEDLLRTNIDEPAGQVRTMALAVKGRACLVLGSPDQAVGCLQKICGRDLHPRFFMDWYWRVVGRLALSRACLASGNLEAAAEQSDRALELARSGADPSLKALAWEAGARVAHHAHDWTRMEECLRHALEALGNRELPFTAWQVHAAASELYRSRAKSDLEARHRECAVAAIQRLIDSFSGGDPLRETLRQARESYLTASDRVRG
jgi:DNA-binding winged helix-turn-helix (wHTH) protein/tetratricopeptide (TPR) repeat protein